MAAEAEGEEDVTDRVEGAGEALAERREAAARFFEQFRSEQQAILKESSALTSDRMLEDVNRILDVLLIRAQALESEFTRLSSDLPKYDLQQYRTGIRALEADIAAKRQELAPRKKFQFRRKKKDEAAGSKADQPQQDGHAPSKIEQPELSDKLLGGLSRGVGSAEVLEFQAQSNAVLTPPPEELAGRDVTLRDLDSCTVMLQSHIGALHCHNLRRCFVLVGAIRSSALIYDCEQTVFTLAAKQLRLHKSHEIVLYLHTLSSPVIEECRRIAVAPFDVVSPDVASFCSAAALGTLPTEENLQQESPAGKWKEFQDFNWLKRQASPNWAILPMEYRRPPLKDLSQTGGIVKKQLLRCEKYWQKASATPTISAEVADDPAQS